MKFQDIWERLGSFWGDVKNTTVEFIGQPDVHVEQLSNNNLQVDGVCKTQNAKIFLSILETTISGEQIVIFLMVGALLGYGLGTCRARKRRVVGLDYPRQMPRCGTPGTPQRHGIRRSTFPNDIPYSNRTGRRVHRHLNNSRNRGRNSSILTHTLRTTAQQQRTNHHCHPSSLVPPAITEPNYHQNPYYYPTAPPRTQGGAYC